MNKNTSAYRTQTSEQILESEVQTNGTCGSGMRSGEK